MAVFKFGSFQDDSLRHRLGQFVKIILPLLACIALTYCSKSMSVYLTEGHHEEAEIMLLKMMQSAALVAPVTSYLFHIVGYGPVLLTGACLTIHGIFTPSLIAENRHQEFVFAVLFGTGISLVFQATAIASSTIFRENIVSSVLLLGLCAATMFTTQQLFEQLAVKFSVHIITGILMLVPVMLIFPAAADIIGARRTKRTEGQDLDDPLLSLHANEDHENTDDESLLKISPTPGTPYSCNHKTDTESNSFATLTFEEMKWRLCGLLWWAIGIHLSFLSSSRESSADIGMISLMCLLSLLTFGVKLFLIERKPCRNNGYDLNNATGYFVLGLLGINGLMLRFYPLSTDVHCFSLLFTMGFFHQLQHSHKGLQIFSNFDLMVNQICIELVLTFCAMGIGYLLANIIYHNVLALIASSDIYSDVILLVVSTASLLLSLKYSIKKEQNITNPPADL